MFTLFYFPKLFIILQSFYLLTSSISGEPSNTLQSNETQKPDYVIGVADLLEITVLGVSDFSRTVRVDSSGTILLPFLGQIEVAGLTLAGATGKLAGLLEGKYVKNPQVSVFVKEPRSRMYSILGAVSRPGQYEMIQPITLVTAISAAGGLELSRSGDRVIIRRHADRSTPVTTANAQSSPATEEEGPPGLSITFQIDLNKLLEQGDPALDIPIEPGDVINIPEKTVQAFYIVGDVHRPGQFAFPDEEGVQLSLAIATAGGPTRTAKLKDTVLLRQLPDGSRQEIVLNLEAILKGKTEDIDLQPNDLIFLPGSVAKSVAYGLLGVIPTTVSSTTVHSIR